MKKTAKTTLAFIAMSLLLVFAPIKQTKAQFSASISFGVFYDELEPYGQWIDDPQYGYVWVPDVGPGFRPYYTGGHWVMTRYGSMWVSDYDWGWAPFHYGRWVYSPYYGWSWIPDYDWGPAWVSWRSGGGYYGWAPLGPGMTISLSFFNSHYISNDWWVFVPDRYYLSPVFYNYSIAPANNITYINNTTYITNTYVNDGITYAAGPSMPEVQRATNGKVHVYDVANVSRPGKTSVQGNSVSTFRPKVSKSEDGTKAAPRKAVSRDQFVKSNPEKVKRNQATVNTASKRQLDQSAVQNKTVEQNNAVRKQKEQPVKVEQKNNKAIQQKQQPVNKPVLPDERKQVQPQNKRVVPETPKKSNQPASQERKHVQPKKNDQPVMQERRQPVNQPTRQPEVERNQPRVNRQYESPRQQNQPVQQQRTQPVQQQRTQPVQQQRTEPVHQQRSQPAPQQQKSHPGGGKKKG